MFFFRNIKGLRWFDRSHDRIGKATGSLKCCFAGFGFFSLLFVKIEDNWTIIVAAIFKLAKSIRWICLLPINRQEILITDFFWVENDFYCFSMPCLMAFDFFIGWIFGMSCGIARKNRMHPFEFIKGLDHTPETPTCKNCSFHYSSSVSAGKYKLI